MQLHEKALTEFLLNSAKTEFCYGKSDCAIWASDWVLLVTNRDPAIDLRGTYDNEIDCNKVVDSYGGLDCLAKTIMVNNGFSLNKGPSSLGDVVVLKIKYKTNCCSNDPFLLSIKTRSGYAFKSKLGVSIISPMYATEILSWRLF